MGKRRLYGLILTLLAAGGIPGPARCASPPSPGIPAATPETAPGDRERGEAFFQQGLYEKSAECLKKAILADPGDWRSYQTLGDAYLEMGDNVEALDAYQKSLAIHPANPAAQAHASELSGTPGPRAQWYDFNPSPLQEQGRNGDAGAPAPPKPGKP